MNKDDILNFQRKAGDLVSSLQLLLKGSEDLKSSQDLLDSQRNQAVKRTKEIEDKAHTNQEKERELIRRELTVESREKAVDKTKDSLLEREKALINEKERLAIDTATLEKEKEKVKVSQLNVSDLRKEANRLEALNFSLEQREHDLLIALQEQDKQSLRINNEWKAIEREKLRLQEEAEKLASY